MYCENCGEIMSKEDFRVEYPEPKEYYYTCPNCGVECNYNEFYGEEWIYKNKFK